MRVALLLLAGVVVACGGAPEGLDVSFDAGPDVAAPALAAACEAPRLARCGRCWEWCPRLDAWMAVVRGPMAVGACEASLTNEAGRPSVAWTSDWEAAARACGW